MKLASISPTPPNINCASQVDPTMEYNTLNKVGQGWLLAGVSYMASQEHLDMLKQGVDTWNRWREEHPEVQPDLSKADLSVNFFVQANLSSTNLFGTNLSVSNCIMANFSKANLSKAKLTMTHFNGTDLSDANLTEADLRMADLSEANLSRADFYGAIVSDVSFYGADLNGANLGGARIGFATFGNVDLSTVKGLDAVIK